MPCVSLLWADPLQEHEGQNQNQEGPRAPSPTASELEQCALADGFKKHPEDIRGTSGPGGTGSFCTPGWQPPTQGSSRQDGVA